ncbi:RhoGAP-domain-containing protein [Saitoella complicata NRRL Y-17804]|uniref:RhoGAP-domain-containing protein n=1 Tax=Saitoella complicata (strain BCRC 22490 / CBS 7301 / JCM 7358 / NBRC 10748 / NRRL Y-17804) TaxID=698492 RepID=A0A0E9NSD2_SAICN|nr:RhoGAP-domain-containing protein [Saitoella complicata NRRL Y-17804]ODQ55567.1 RhoGAP-domain-containing protein [Saitoella complicata NRRL Y-17804]GAO52764.1 hypothetical protein G7K_6832-t1 [Saitoella complicata NRRL Y-17804]
MMSSMPSIQLAPPPGSAGSGSIATSEDGTQASQDPCCHGCRGVIEEGSVVAFGENIWHVECFRCAKCNSLVDHDSNLLLLADGSPICENCSYNCRACNKRIDDLAIMTGDESYHSECFRCRLCKSKIEDLVFAKTSSGIYCISCHNERMARSRKHRTRDKDGTRASGLPRDKTLPEIPPHLASSQSTMQLSEIARARSPIPPMSSPGLSDIRTPSPANAEVTLAPPPTEVSKATKRQSRLFTADMDALSAFMPPPSPTRRAPTPSEAAAAAAANRNGTSDFIPIMFDEKPMKTSNTIATGLGMGGMGGGGQFNTWSPKQGRPAELRQMEEQYDNANANNGTPGVSMSSLPFRAPSGLGKTSALPEKKGGFLSRKLSLVRKNSLPDDQLALPNNEGEKHSPPSSRRKSLKGFGGFSGLKRTTTLQDLGNLGQDNTAIPESPRGMPRQASASPLVPSPSMQTIGGSSPVPPLPPTPSSARFATVSGGKIVAAGDNGNNAPQFSEPNYGAFNASQSSLGVVSQGQGAPSDVGSAAASVFAPSRKSSYGSVLSQPAPVAPAAPSPTSVGSKPRLEASRKSSSTSVLSVQESFVDLPEIGALSMDDDVAKLMAKHESGTSTTTITRLSQALKHGRSLSDLSGTKSVKLGRESSRSPKAAGGWGRRASITSSPRLDEVAEEDDEKKALRRELRNSSQRIVELESKVLEDGKKPTEEEVEVNIQEKRNTLVDLEAKREIRLAELRALMKERTETDAEMMKANIIAELTDSLDELKASFEEQIEDLINQRNKLFDENTRLQMLRTQAIEEAHHLNQKNIELTDLNNELMQEIQSKVKTHGHGKSPNVGAGQSGGFGLFGRGQKEKEKQMNYNHSQASLASSATAVPTLPMSETTQTISTILTSDPAVVVADRKLTTAGTLDEGEVVMEPATVVDPHNQEFTPPPKKFNWKKGAKGAVKGFNKFWASENSGMPAGGTGMTMSQSAPNGLNIMNLPRSITMNNLSAMAKSHSFQPSKFARSAKCDHCSDKLRGSELRCVACGFQCHTKCLPDIAVSCMGSGIPEHDGASVGESEQKSDTLFGGDLGKQAELEGRPIPHIVTCCIDEVEKRGMDFEGIYRKSGGASQMRTIQEMFEAASAQAGEVDLSEAGDICGVTSVLKQYFRHLSTPLMTYDLYHHLLDAVSSSHDSDSDRLSAIRSVLTSMPETHYLCLRYLMLHLGRVAGMAGTNLMHAKNLAVVFSPTLMRDRTGVREITDMQGKSKLMQLLIEHAEVVFAE